MECVHVIPIANEKRIYQVNDAMHSALSNNSFPSDTKPRSLLSLRIVEPDLTD